MPALKALRALLVILGLLALAPAQAAGFVEARDTAISSCDACFGSAKQVRKGASGASAMYQASHQPGPDDGCANGTATLVPVATRIVATAPLAKTREPDGAAAARLDRPPKTA